MSDRIDDLRHLLQKNLKMAFAVALMIDVLVITYLIEVLP